MADRAAIPPVPGLLTAFVGPPVIPLTVAYFATANTLERVSFRVVDPPSGGSVTAELNTESDGSGDSISAEILDGDDFATNTGTVTIDAGSYLYLRITAESGGAMSLSGEYEITTASGVTVMLTTISQFHSDAGITTTDTLRDQLINNVILGVSKRMQDWMDRQIIQLTATDEKIDSIGDYKIQTLHYPIISVSSLEESATALVEDTDFEMNSEDLARGWIARISGSNPIAWAKGYRVVKLTYVHGYAAVPDSLMRAATAQAVNDYHQTPASGKGWRGLLSKGVDPASAVAYDKDFWERETVPVMRPYRRQVV
jgi:hypothetical protein